MRFGKTTYFKVYGNIHFNVDFSTRLLFLFVIRFKFPFIKQ